MTETVSEYAIPNELDINEAVQAFAAAYGYLETAMSQLLQAFPGHDVPSNVLLKVVVLNRLYSTNIFAVDAAAKHIVDHAAQITAGIESGDPEVIPLLAHMQMPDGKTRYNFSFATKYCSWHNRAAFPIYDSRAERYLWNVQCQRNFMQREMKRSELWFYASFKNVVNTFQNYYHLEQFDYKQIDQYLWTNGVEMPSAKPL